MTQDRKALARRLLAELLVIILGVLIAVQVENWRQGAASRRLETAQLRALRADLRENRVRLDSVQLWQDSAVHAGQFIVALHAGQASRPDDLLLASRVGWALSWWRFEPISGAYDAMVSSGDITRLQNQDLLRQLASFYGDVNVEFEDQAESMALVSELRRAQARHGLDAMSPRLVHPYKITWAPSASALDELVADRQFVGLLAVRTRLEVNRAELYKRVSGELDRMLSAIEEELADRDAL